MVPRLQPLNNRNGTSVPRAFAVNQTRPEGRSMRPVHENQAVAELRAEMERNDAKAAKAKATREANLMQANHLTMQGENQVQAQGGPPSTPLSHYNHVGRMGPQTHQSLIYPAQPPQWPLGVKSTERQAVQPPLNLLNELNDPEISFYSGETFQHQFQENSSSPPVFHPHNGVLNSSRNANSEGLLSTPTVGTQATAPGNYETETLWNLTHTITPETELEQDVSDKESEPHRGIDIMGRDIHLKNRKVQGSYNTSMQNANFGQSELQSDAANSIDVMSDEDSISTTPITAGRASRSVRVLAADVRRVVVAAQELLREHLTKVNPYPDGTSRHQPETGIDEYTSLAMELWVKACANLDLKITRNPTPEEIQHILGRTSHFRGQVRDKASALVAHAYNFVDLQTVQVSSGKDLSGDEEAKIKAENREKYAAIKNTFYYQHPEDASVPNTMYRHPIIQHVLNTAWFGKDTYARGHYFARETKLPIVTIAFIATAIENALDAWKEGEFKRVDFRCKAYHEAYIEHLEELQAWKAYTANEPHDLATQLQVSLLETARCRIKGTGVVRHISEVDKREKKRARLERFGANQGSTSAS